MHRHLGRNFYAQPFLSSSPSYQKRIAFCGQEVLLDTKKINQLMEKKQKISSKDVKNYISN